jgi:ABC-2 type transport system ATP-binding protein
VVLAAEGLWWRYGRGPWLLEDLTLSVPAGAVLRVVGGNGSGKSTLLGLLAGCAVPCRGAVVTDGRVGYLPQLARALPAIPTGLLLRTLTGRPHADDPVLAQHTSVGADDLSGGTARRLLLEAVLSFDTRVLVVDEPAAGLDATAVARLAAVLRQRREAGCTVVIADHGELEHSLPADDVLDLGGLSPRTQDVRVVLRGEGSLRGQAAAHGVLELVVADSDALLHEALAAGWSVLAVERAS